MKEQMSNRTLFLYFTSLTGAVIAGIVWLYLKVANVGITVIWEMVPVYIDSKYYTVLMCLGGGVLIGLFHRVYGPYPERMADSVKRVKDTGTYPYRKLPMIVSASFLSLFFGGAVGPESGLVSLLLGLCCWAMDQFGLARWKMETLIAGNPYIRKKELFRVMAAGLFLPPDQIVYDKGKISWKRKEQIASGITAGLTGLAVYELLNFCFGRCLAVPHLHGGVLILTRQSGSYFAGDCRNCSRLSVSDLSEGQQLVFRKTERKKSGSIQCRAWWSGVGTDRFCITDDHVFRWK